MEINYSLKLATSVREIEKSILRAIAEELNTQLFKQMGGIQNNIRKIIERAFKDQPEYKSLQGGKLQSELGVVDAKNKIDVIIDRWIDSIILKIDAIKVSNQGLKGKILINLVPKSYDDVLSLPEASYITKKGQKIEWLRWLLLEGDKFVVKDYMIGQDKRGTARTKLGQIMINRGRLNVGWQVPPEFSGTARNNFATRALLSVQDDIDREIHKILK